MPCWKASQTPTKSWQLWNLASEKPQGAIIAVNAVMAGCLPEHLEVLVAAVSALSRPEFNLRGVNATTHPVSPLLITHGVPGFASGLGAFGPGNRHNASAGRALRFILMHVAGAKPGDGDASTQGQPSKIHLLRG